MKKQLLRLALVASILFLASCSGGDDSPTPVANTDQSQLMGKWVIYKAIYDGNTDTIYYESNGSCGREVLEFYNDNEVTETFYIDEDCMFGGSGSHSWWVLDNGTFAMGAVNSFHHTVTVNGNKLFLDGWEEGGFRKYYNKSNE